MPSNIRNKGFREASALLFSALSFELALCRQHRSLNFSSLMEDLVNHVLSEHTFCTEHVSDTIVAAQGAAVAPGGKTSAPGSL